MNSPADFKLLMLRSKIRKPFELTVSGTSMLPILREGDAISVCSQDYYEIGDILVFIYKGNELLVHRLLKIENGRYFCKGDNSFRLEDIMPEHIISKVLLDNDKHNTADFVITSLEINSVFHKNRYDIEKTKLSSEYQRYRDKYLEET